jgi:hypothetical protein
MGAQTVREFASKTSDRLGDGTSTATVVAQAIVREGAKAVGAGMNPSGSDARQPRIEVVLFERRQSSASKKARARSSGGGCRAVPPPLTRSAFSFMRSPTISAISCERLRCPRRRNRGRLLAYARS